MRDYLRLPVLAVAAVLVLSACGTAATPSPSAGESAAAPTEAASAEGSASQPAAAEQGVDDGTKITMWTRAATEARARPLVDAYNASHKNQVELTVVPTDDYQAKVGAAAGSGGLPDLFSADVVFMPNWTSQGLFTDITDRINNLPVADKLAQSHITVATWQGKKYAPAVHHRPVGLAVQQDSSSSRRGSIPNKPPTTLQEFADDARAVAKLGGDIHGTFFGGNCGGCEVFTWWPIAWADGEKVMSDDGTQSLLNSAENKADLLDLQEPRRRWHRLDAGLEDRDRPDMDRLLPHGQGRDHADAGHDLRASRATTSSSPTSGSRRSPASRAASRPSSAATASASPRTARSPTRPGTSWPGW